MTSIRVDRLTRGKIDRIIEQLKDVQSLLPDPDGIYGDDDDDIVYGEPGHIESAEIEVAISSLISTLTVEFGLNEEPETLPALFTRFFSSEDDAVSLATNFGDSINGYFGELFGEDLGLAHAYMKELIELLETRRDNAKERTPKLRTRDTT